MLRVIEQRYDSKEAASRLEPAGARMRLGRAALCSALLVAPALAFAEAWIVTPELNIRSGYDNNVRLTPEGVINNVENKANGAVETNASVALGVATLTQISELRARVRADFISYSQEEEEEIDNEDNQYLDVSGSYKLTPINTIGARFSLERKYTGTDDTRDFFNRATDESLEDPSNELANVDTDTGVTRVQVRRERLQVEPYWQVGLTQNTQLRLQYRYDETVYGSGSADARLVDFTRQRASARVQHNLSETSRVFFSIDGGTYEAADRNVLVPIGTAGEFETLESEGRETDEIAARFGYRYNFSPISIVGFNLGARRLSFDNPNSSNADIDEEDDTGEIVRVFGEHRGELTRYTASLGRTVTPSGNGGLVESDIIEFDFSRSLSPRFNFRIESEYFGNSSVGNADARSDRDYVRVSPVLTWNWTPEWAVNLIYEYEWEERDINEDVISGDIIDADSHGVFLSIVYKKANEIGR